MNPESSQLLPKAERAIRSADRLLTDGDIDFAVSRAYYAMFYVALALLREKRFRPKSHAGVHTLFGQHLLRPGLIDAVYHKWLQSSFDARLAGDYTVAADLVPDAVALTIDRARQFLTEARRILA